MQPVHKNLRIFPPSQKTALPESGRAVCLQFPVKIVLIPFQDQLPIKERRHHKDQQEGTQGASHAAPGDQHQRCDADGQQYQEKNLAFSHNLLLHALHKTLGHAYHTLHLGGNDDLGCLAVSHLFHGLDGLELDDLLVGCLDRKSVV